MDFPQTSLNQFPSTLDTAANVGQAFVLCKALASKVTGKPLNGIAPLALGLNALQACRALSRIIEGNSDYYFSNRFSNDALFLAGISAQTATLVAEVLPTSPWIKGGLWLAGVTIDAYGLSQTYQAWQAGSASTLDFLFQGCITFIFMPNMPFRIEYIAKPAVSGANIGILEPASGFGSFHILFSKSDRRPVTTPIGNKLVELRGLKGWTLDDAAQASGLSKKPWRKTETSPDPKISKATLTKIADALGVPYESLAALMKPAQIIETQLSAFGAFLRELRINSGLTIREASSRAGISDTSWDRAERGSIPRKNTIGKMAETVGVTTDELLAKCPTPPPKKVSFIRRPFGPFVRELRLEAALSIANAAKRAGINKTSWERIETQGQIPSRVTLSKMAGALGVEEVRLLEQCPSKKITPPQHATPPTSAFGKRIEELRRARGWTIEVAAKKAGIQKGTWSDAELTNKPIFPNTIKKMARVLQRTYRQLAGLIDEQRLNNGLPVAASSTPLGHRIRYSRLREAGLTVTEACRLSGVSEETWRRIELGQAEPTERTLGKIANVLGVSQEELKALAGKSRAMHEVNEPPSHPTSLSEDDPIEILVRGTDANRQIREEIRALRLKKGYDIEVVARALNVSPQIYELIEAGALLPNAVFIKTIRAILNKEFY